MSRLKKQERQKQLTEKLNITPFLTDEELASHFGVSVPTIRLDRLELGIPELRERIKAMATEHAQDEQPEPIQHEIVGELIDVTEGFVCSSKFLGQASYGFNPLLCRGGEY